MYLYSYVISIVENFQYVALYHIALYEADYEEILEQQNADQAAQPRANML